MKQSLRYGLVAMMSVCVIALAGCNSQDLKVDLGSKQQHNLLRRKIRSRWIK